MLNQADIERAKQELRLRRAQTLKRHSEELHRLDAEQAELETLEKLAQSFSRKFGGSPAEETTPEAVSTGKEPAAPEAIPGLAPTSPAFSSQQRKYQATNFELFTRAFSHGTF